MLFKYLDTHTYTETISAPLLLVGEKLSPANWLLFLLLVYFYFIIFFSFLFFCSRGTSGRIRNKGRNWANNSGGGRPFGNSLSNKLLGKRIFWFLESAKARGRARVWGTLLLLAVKAFPRNYPLTPPLFPLLFFSCAAGRHVRSFLAREPCECVCVFYVWTPTGHVAWHFPKNLSQQVESFQFCY